MTDTRITTIHLNIYSANLVTDDVWALYRYGRSIGRTVHGDRFDAYDAMRRLHGREISK